jgi:Protein of unknown function (DUF2924)
MQKKRRNGRAPTKTSVEDEIAHLRGLDLKGLRSRWQSVFQRAAPAHLTRHLLFAVIAYRIQADRIGDLDHATLQMLERTVAKETGPEMSARLASFDQKGAELSPGTVLVRGQPLAREAGGNPAHTLALFSLLGEQLCQHANQNHHGNRYPPGRSCRAVPPNQPEIRSLRENRASVRDPPTEWSRQFEALGLNPE